MNGRTGLIDDLFGAPLPDSAESTPSGLDPTLEDNLCALLDRDDPSGASEELIRRILFAESGNHVIIGGPNPPLYRAQGRLKQFTVHDDELEERLGDVRDGDEVFVFGISLGEEVAHLLRTRPNASIVVWERDPWLIRLALTRQDYTRSLTNGRLTLALAADLIDHLPRLHECRVVLHPTFRGIYVDEMQLVTDAITGARTADSRRWIGLGMGGIVVSYIADSLRTSGYSVFPFEMQRWDAREVEISMRKLQPERLITVNYDAGLAAMCDELNVPLVVWEIDPTTDRTPTPPGTNDQIRMFTLRESDVEPLRASGFMRVEHLPLGVNTDMRYPTKNDGELGSIPVAFVGSSLKGRAARFRRLFLQLHASFDCCGSMTFEETEEQLESVLRAERADYSKYVTGDLVEEKFGAFLAAAERSSTPADPRKWVAEIVASQKRIAYVSALADEGIHVWGDSAWASVQKRSPKLTYHGTADFGKELTQIYSTALINIDVNRIYQRDAIPMRVFDVLACGGFLIAEYSEALAEQFDLGKELVAYRTLEELEQLVRHYRAAPAEVEQIAAAGLEAVRKRHTMKSRVARLVAES